MFRFKATPKKYIGKLYLDATMFLGVQNLIEMRKRNFERKWAVEHVQHLSVVVIFSRNAEL